MDLDELQAEVLNSSNSRRSRDSRPQTVSELYIFHEEIGKGAYGTVYRAVRRENQKVYAIKQIDKKRAGAKGMSEIYSEVETLDMLSHPNIVRLEETIDEVQNLYLVLEYVDGGELQHVLNKNGPFPEASVKKLVMSLLMAVEYIHRKGIVHRDLKLANCLLIDEEDVAVKIADFGFSAMVGHDTCLQRYCGTTAYMAPEIIMDMNYGKPVDMWAVGVITYVLLSGTYPFHADNVDEILKKISAVEYSFSGPAWKDASVGVRDFITKCFTFDPYKRITAQQALRHTWVMTSITSDFTSEPIEDPFTPLDPFATHSPHRVSSRRRSDFRVSFLHQWKAWIRVTMACHRLVYLHRSRSVENLGIMRPCFAYQFGYLATGKYEPKSGELCVRDKKNISRYVKLVSIALEMTEVSRTIHTLDLSDCGIDSLNAIQQIVRVVTDHPSLHVLHLDLNPLPHLGGRALVRLARNALTLRRMGLAGTGLLGDVVQQITASLKDNEKKRALLLNSGSITMNSSISSKATSGYVDEEEAKKAKPRGAAGMKSGLEASGTLNRSTIGSNINASNQLRNNVKR